MKTTPRHIIIRLLKTSDNEKILKAVREKNTTIYAEGKTNVRMTSDSVWKTM